MFQLQNHLSIFYQHLGNQFMFTISNIQFKEYLPEVSLCCFSRMRLPRDLRNAALTSSPCTGDRDRKPGTLRTDISSPLGYSDRSKIIKVIIYPYLSYRASLEYQFQKNYNH